ncbi:hypothetical protein ACFQO8_11100 [Exiguobacterium aestuarii]|uniref:Uncharacterized protein n=1 Tax=Exiguobacterium aestuarii TaxID=273527 RepID=A0ABW2PNK6_9BACL|nr:MULTISPECIES: hypothetical protein [Exiguobacterium]MCT4785171.1 hypothetical protein [Exiguobacterium aestuarii]
MKKKRKANWVYTFRRLVVFLVPLGCALWFWPHESTPTTQLKSEHVSMSEEIYTIEERSPVQDDGVTRYVYDVVVHGEPSTDELQSISHDVIDEVRQSDQFQAALLRFYDDAAYIGTDPTLGEAVFAPEGDYALADWVEPGQTDEMSFGWQLREKEWSTKLTDKEIQIWALWQEQYTKQDPDDPDVKSKVTRIVSNEYDLDPKAVQQVVLKQHVWAVL